MSIFTRLFGRRSTKQLVEKSIELNERSIKVLNRVGLKLRGLAKASDIVLALYIREIDVLTPAKLTAIRRLRYQLDH